MTIPLEKKEPLLRKFDQIMDQDGWTFNENGPDEKDRDLLVHFDCVIREFKEVKPAYRDIILDITKKMGDGMADYCNNAEHNLNGVNTIKDYELYCHYVAGLVGEGLTRLFVESGLANPALIKRPELSEAMGQFLQKTNIIRDIKEDFDDKRRFYPKEIWSKYVTNFDELFDPKNIKKALGCSSEMVLNSLRHADECLFYMAGIKDQSVFNFVAIPQAMAIATLELVFQNPDIFKKNVKITKGDACQLMLESSQNLRTMCDIFKRYARRIAKKNTPTDPNFLEISIACGKVGCCVIPWRMVLTTPDRAIHRINLPNPRPQSHHPPPRRRPISPHTRTDKDKSRGTRGQERRLLPPAGSPGNSYFNFCYNGTLPFPPFPS